MEHIDIDTDLIQRHSMPEIVEARERQKEYESKFEDSYEKDWDDGVWHIRREANKVARKYPRYMRMSGHYVQYRIDDAWLVRHGAHLKHVALWRHVHESSNRSSVDEASKVRYRYARFALLKVRFGTARI